MAKTPSRRELRQKRWDRLGKARRERWRFRFRRLKRASVATFAILFGAAVWAVAAGGFADRALVLTILTAIAAFIVLAIFPRTPRPRVEDLQKTDVASLADATVQWLDAQRRALPGSVHDTLDVIGANLEQLSPQLASLPEASPASREVRRLLGVHLPALVNSYTGIPDSLRDRPHAGSTPEQQVSQGLSIIAREIESVTHQIARGELDQLAIRGRYLETRYVGSGED